MNRRNIKLLIEAVTLYAIGEDHTYPMEELSYFVGSNSEWKFVCDCLELVDQVMVDNGKGTVQQTEKVLAKRENREDRNALVFDDKDKRTQVAIMLADEFTKEGIKFEATK